MKTQSAFQQRMAQSRVALVKKTDIQWWIERVKLLRISGAK